jgi:creatinine amidohydrolase/Fe(II)-dependent formamide hydrolase-like protein
MPPCSFRRRHLIVAVSLSTMLSAAPPARAQGPSVYLEDLTSPELRERIDAGTTTVLVPVGGTEQNGPHMVLGKHNTRARVLAGLIAQRLGNAVVAPVVAYVPQGSIRPPVAHMRFAGTISLPDAVFEGLLEATARSFKQHGFKDVVYLGDHGGYQRNDERVADRLNREWAGDPSCRVLALTDYYRVTQTAFVDELKHKGYTVSEIGTHAGLADTALALAVDKSLVRADRLARAGTHGDGVAGDPRRATVELGQAGVERIVETSVRAIRDAARLH